MEIVTGDRYLDMLARFVEANVAALLDGSRVLKLNPLGLHYLQARLESLQELEQLHSAAPVDYLRAYIADLGDHRALELLRRVFGLLASVKVVALMQSPARDPTPINLLPFERLRSLELRGCDLSTSAARGLVHLRPHLEKLICHNSTDALRHVLAERMVDIGSTQPWSRLSTVSCACNAVPVMDDSLQLLPAVEVLDLRRNRLTHVSSLGNCKRIRFLDLGFNWIQSVSRIDQVSSSLTALVLRFNALSITKGIESLFLLRHLDLSHNVISDFRELERVGGLRFLGTLCLRGNPVTCAPDYRERAFSFFPAPGELCLDGRRPSRLEEWKVHRLSLSKCKRDGAFGLYAPALKPAAARDGTAHKGRKRSPRLAVIVSGETADHSAALADQGLDSVACVDQEAQVEVRVERLMKRAQALKKDNSTSWLANVSDLFEVEECQAGGTRPDSLLRKKHSRRRRKSGLASEAASQASSASVGTCADISGSTQVLDKLVRRQASPRSRATPPHFSRGVLERRRKLEQELLQASVGAVDAEDSSTSASDGGDSASLPGADAANAQLQDRGSSSYVLGGDESCFSNPMWVGSSAANSSNEELEKLKLQE